jgi:hypothetical protein
LITGRAGQLGEFIVSELHGRDYETNFRGNMFYGSLQAATALSVALATTYTGLCLSNPAGNTKNLTLKKVTFALTVAPAAIASIGLIGGYNVAGVTVHTTPLASPAIGANVLGSAAMPTAKVDAACTLVGTPFWMAQILGGFTAASLPAGGPAMMDWDGSIIIQPGGYVAIGALTAVTGLASMFWEETPQAI